MLSLGQVEEKSLEAGIYRTQDKEGWVHDLVIRDNYLVENIYRIDPPAFKRSIGGPYKLSEGELQWELEFNSDTSSTLERKRSLPYSFENGNLRIEGEVTRTYEALAGEEQALDGIWYFATRGPDEGQERRSPQRPRRTLKILQDGHFQWIAFNSETFKFSGTGGGTYDAEGNTYTENIRFFSRDPERVGAQLNFKYELDGSDWHHRGKTSKGDPMYEIWSRY